MTTTASNNFESSDLFPVYCKYPGQFTPQPAYIVLDLESGEVSADYNPNIGSGMSSRAWHGVERHWRINEFLTTPDIHSLINENLEYFQSILDRSEVKWNGNNFIGIVEGLEPDETEKFCGFEPSVEIVDLKEYLANGEGVFPKDQTITEFINEIVAEQKNGIFYSTSGELHADEIQSELLSIWADCLYSGDDLPQDVAKLLIETGYCDDSQWTLELAAYADGRQPE